jgi:hypothetical protein
MKKYFKFLTVAAIFAAGLVACSGEEPIPTLKPGEEPGVPGSGEQTFATFKFSAGADTKALDPQTTEAAPGVASFRLLVFNNADAIEVDTATTTNTLTVSLVSGMKKIFVFANNAGNTIGGSSGGYLGAPARAAGAPSTITTANFNRMWDIVGAGSVAALTQTVAPAASGTGLTQLYGDLIGPFYYSNSVDSATHILAAGISQAQSQDPTPSVNGGNYIPIYVERLVAKVALTYTSTALASTTDGKGAILTGSVGYRIWNMNRAVYPFRNSNSSMQLLSAYGDVAPVGTSPNETYAPYYY